MWACGCGTWGRVCLYTASVNPERIQKTWNHSKLKLWNFNENSLAYQEREAEAGSNTNLKTKNENDEQNGGRETQKVGEE